MWKYSIRNVVVIFQDTILRVVGFYVRRSSNDFGPIQVHGGRLIYPSYRKLYGRFVEHRTQPWTSRGPGHEKG